MKKRILYSTLASIALVGATGYLAIAQQSSPNTRSIAATPDPGNATLPAGSGQRRVTGFTTSNGEMVVATAPGQYAYGFSMGGDQELLVIEDGSFRIEQVDGNVDPEMRKKSEEAKKELSDALKTIRSDTSEKDEVKKAKATITSYLSAQFENDQKKRQGQVKSLEEQIVKLKKQIEKREAKKQELIDLRLAILENDTAGLSFPPAWDHLNQPGGPGGFSVQGPTGFGVNNVYFPGAAGQPATVLPPSVTPVPIGVPSGDRPRALPPSEFNRR